MLNNEILAAVYMLHLTIGRKQPKLAISIQKPAQVRSLEGFENWRRELLSQNRQADKIPDAVLEPLKPYLAFNDWSRNQFKKQK